MGVEVRAQREDLVPQVRQKPQFIVFQRRVTGQVQDPHGAQPLSLKTGRSAAWENPPLTSGASATVRPAPPPGARKAPPPALTPESSATPPAPPKARRWRCIGQYHHAGTGGHTPLGFHVVGPVAGRQPAVGI